MPNDGHAPTVGKANFEPEVIIENHRAKCGRPTVEAPATEDARQARTGLLSETRRATDHSERYAAEEEFAPSPPTNQANRLAWEMSAFWIFALFSFAALIFAVYVIWTKCEGNSP